MPMLDVYIPDGALQPGAEAALLHQITEILIRYEGFDAASQLARSASWFSCTGQPPPTSAGRPPT